MLKWVAIEEKDEDKGDDFREIGELGDGVEKKLGLKRCKCVSVSGWCMKRVLKWIIPPNAIKNWLLLLLFLGLLMFPKKTRWTFTHTICDDVKGVNV